MDVRYRTTVVCPSILYRILVNRTAADAFKTLRFNAVLTSVPIVRQGTPNALDCWLSELCFYDSWDWEFLWFWHVERQVL